MTDPSAERRALALFEQMLAVPEADREQWLAERTAGDPTLATRLAAMRDADRRAALGTGAASDAIDADAERLPERIGAYCITGLIGRGGMGSVYRGERAAGDFSHSVAIKVIKPGLLSEALVERFLRERQTLAQLRHPNIAQLYDGGETESGSPFIVMELVEGQPLLAWVEAQGLTSDARAELFASICGAVAFAHRNLVVHRDITPSNILVTADGTPKLIDFGIAKPADEEDQSAAAPSGARSLSGLSLTPGYAAPERLASTRVTTAADIFSLGKVLAALLPERDQDLTAIVARATATDPVDRYSTVEELAADVEAWRTRMPVAARQGGRAYVARRFVSRHRLAVAASAIAILMMAGTTIYALVANVRAQEARAEAEQRFEQVHALANAMLFELDGALARVPGNTGARAALAERAEHYLHQLADSAGADPSLRLDTARGLIRLARIQGVPNEPNLGAREAAVANLERASDLLERTPQGGARGESYRGLIDIYRALIELHGNSDQAAARAALASAQRRLDEVGAGGLEWHEARRALRIAQLDFADAASERAGIGALIEAMRRDRQSWPAELRSGDAARIDDAHADYYLALQRAEHDQAGAVQAHLAVEQAYDQLLQAHRDDPVLLYRAAWNGMDGFAAASQLGREDVSNRLIRKAAAIIDRLAVIDDRDNAVRALQANIREALAQNLRDADHFEEAIALQREVVAERERVALAQPTGRQLGNLGFSYMILGVIGRDGGNRALACESWTNSLDAMRRAQAIHQIIGFHEGFIPGLASHVRSCATGGPISSPLR